MLHCRAHLRAVEPGRSVDAAVADEHDVVLGGETARVREHHVGDAGAALEAEDRDTRMGRMGTNHYDRKCDQARVRIMAVLGHDERPAIRGGGAVLSRVVAALERQLACMRAGRHGDRLRAAGEVEVAEPEREDGDQGRPVIRPRPKRFATVFLPLLESGWSCLELDVSSSPSETPLWRGFDPAEDSLGGGRAGRWRAGVCGCGQPHHQAPTCCRSCFTHQGSGVDSAARRAMRSEVLYGEHAPVRVRCCWRPRDAGSAGAGGRAAGATAGRSGLHLAELDRPNAGHCPLAGVLSARPSGPASRGRPRPVARCGACVAEGVSGLEDAR